MSKSLGNVVDPIYIVDTYGADPLRYVLLRDVPAGEDGDFSEKALIDRNNGDLADSLGNLLQRTSVLIHKHFKGNVPVCGKLTKEEKELEKAIPDVKELDELMQKYKWHHVVEKIWNYIGRCNKYINDAEPWKKTNDAERLATILYTLVEHLRIISILTWPIIPGSAEKLAEQIGQKIGKLKDVKFTKKTTGDVLEPKILFTKREAIKQESPFAKLNLKVARVEKVEVHPNADKLYVVKLDAGEERQLVAGLKQYYSPEELAGKHVVFVSNLKTAKLRGVESQGMLLAAEKDGVVRVLEAPGGHGDQVFIDGVTPQTKQITIDDFLKIKLTTKNKEVVYEGKVLKTNKGNIKVDMPDDAKIR